MQADEMMIMSYCCLILKLVKRLMIIDYVIYVALVLPLIG